jgi:hypothetical protein
MNSASVNHERNSENGLYAVFTEDPAGKLVCWGEGLRSHPRTTHMSMIDGFDQLPQDEAADRADDLDFWFSQAEVCQLLAFLLAERGQVTIVRLTSEQHSRELLGLLTRGACTECEERHLHGRQGENQVLGFHTSTDASNGPPYNN